MSATMKVEATVAEKAFLMDSALVVTTEKVMESVWVAAKVEYKVVAKVQG